MALVSELLFLFISQAEGVRGLIAESSAPSLTDELHRIKGSARALGAHAVAEAVEALECVAAQSAADRSGRRALDAALADASRYAASLLLADPGIGLAKTPESR